MEGKWQWIVGGIIAVLGAAWWYNTQSGAVAMNDGSYDCQVVSVGTDGKYQIVTSGGQDIGGYIKVEAGKVVSLSAPRQVLEWSETPDLSYDNEGRNHVKVTDNESYPRTRFAFACDHRG